VLSGGVLYGAYYDTQRAGSYLYAFAADCGRDDATCAPLWLARIDGGLSGPVVAGGFVFVSAQTRPTRLRYRLRCRRCHVRASMDGFGSLLRRTPRR